MKTTITNMKQIRFDNNRTSSGRNSRSLATKRMLHRVVAILVLAFVCSGVWATDYVFTYNNGYLANNKGTIEYVTTFDPSTCIWTCYNGTTETSLSSNSSYSLKNGNYYLTGSTTNGNAPGLSTDASNSWRSDGTRLYYRSGGTSYYLYYRDTKWRTSKTEGWNGNNTSYRGGSSSYTDYRATATASTTSNAKDNTTAPAISIEGLNGSSGIQLSHTDIGGTYTPEATTIAVGKTTYYKQTDGTYSTTAPSAELNPSYAWSVPSGSATVSSTGVLTLSNNNTQNVTVRLTTTYAGNKTKTTDLKISATSVSALNDQSTPDITITPASATIDLSGSQTFSVPATISQTIVTRDAYVEIKSGSQTYYKVGNTYQTTQPEEVETPGDPISFSSATWTLTENDGYLTNSGLSGQTITLTRDNTKKVGDNKTVTISVSASYDTNSKSATAIAKIPFTYIDLTALTAGDAINMGIGSTTSINGHFSYTPSDNSNGRPYTSFTYTSANTSVATVDSNGKITAVAPGTTTITVQSKKINGENGPSCTVTVNVSLVAPAISIDNDGYVTITDNNAAGSGVSIRYTVDGSTPTSTAGTAYNSKFGPVDNLTLVKAVAYKGTASSAVTSKQYITSGVIPGPGGSGGTVILNDYEDHNWTYYAGVHADVDGGTYNATYSGRLYSPNPRNVKITYKGNGQLTNGTAVTGVKVGIDAPETTFVYYKTIENNNGYKYTTIPNPFSVRPKLNGTYYGFSHWKVTSISGGTINGLGANNTVNAETEITFVPSGTYTTNCTSMEVELEAVWGVAEVITSGSFKNDYGVERMFYVMTSSDNNNITNKGKACTYTSIYPNGTKDGTNAATMNDRKYRRGGFTCSADSKFEYIYLNDNGSTLNAHGKNLIVGRGVSNSNGTGVCATNVIGVTGNETDWWGTETSPADPSSNLNYTIRLESGIYTNYHALATGGTFSGTNKIRSVFGSDYDRAKNNDDNLSITSNLWMGEGCNFSSSTNGTDGYYKCWVKSGKLLTSDITDGTGGTQSIYLGTSGNQNRSKYIPLRSLYLEGGILGGVAGGLDDQSYTGSSDFRVMVRMTGGYIKGCLYGAGSYARGAGERRYVITGGEIGGWVAAGCNGIGGNTTSDNNGATDGDSYVYIGGDAAIGYKNTTVNDVEGGNVFGAGRGASGQSYDVGTVNNSNVVIADQSKIEKNVYGGGNYGFVASGGTAKLYIAGGTVDGSVFGGANMVQGQTVSINMVGGLVKSGVYGGSNTQGAINNNVTMQINGGQVGTKNTPANVHGGGYGNSTRVLGSVNLTVGEANATTGATIYGDVYGGSAEGKTNGNDSRTTNAVTNVTLNAGTINGSLYGGGLGTSGTNGNAADVYGPVQVTVNGGSVVKNTSISGSGNVFGCNNVNGTPMREVTVTINGTDQPESGYALNGVYGGGNLSDYVPGTGLTAASNGIDEYPQVYVKGCDNSIKDLYGGGNAASVPDTYVEVEGGTIDRVFAGGNGESGTPAHVGFRADGTTTYGTGTATANIMGGTINQVFGGSNANGNISGAVTINVDKNSDCAMHIDEVYGGGNEADGKVGTINIGCTGAEGEGIGTVYGGANNAAIGTSTNKSNITLNITGGSIDNVFGGNNNGGIINGTITVNVDWATGTSACGYNYLGNVYGAGNMAAYTGNPVVNVKNGTVTGNVFGGGLSAEVTGNTDVEVTGGEVKTAVYGGGALANVTGNTTVNLFGGTVNDVYGGGLGRNASGTEGQTGYLPAVAALVGGNTNVTLGGTVSGNLVGSVVTGSIFGCNNINGTPQGHAKVLINKTTAQSGAATDAYHVAAVYGGGNQAAYIPTSSTDFAEVEVVGCNNSIQYVYGGGNAASTPATKVTIEGGRLYYVFGGGNGKTEDGATIQNPGADVGYKNWTYDDTNAYGAGTTNVNIYGGTITSVFGGSNTKGNIRVASNVTLDDSEECDFEIGDVYGAGNEAEMYGNGNLTIGCIPGLDEIYGGAKNANINGDVSITITNGEFEKVFGGNNLGGDIKGSITVNIEETGCRPIVIGELYGGGNLAAYTAPTDAAKYSDNAGKFPMVNVKSFTSIGTVFGAGLGMTDAKIDALSTDDLKEAAKALGETDAEIASLSVDALKALTTPYFKAKGVVHGSPQVNINMIEGAWKDGWPAEGTKTYPAISNKWNNKLGTIGTVYGGGNAANVEGDTYVNIGTVSTISLVSGDDHSAKDVQGVNILGNVYGGGNAADVTGKTNVQIGQAGTTSSGE